MKPGTVYIARAAIPAYDRPNDDDVRLVEGRKYHAVATDIVIDRETNVMFGLPRLQASNASWYFREDGKLSRPEVTMKEFAHEVVRCNEGLMLTDLFSIALDCSPRGEFSRASFASALSADHRIEMHDQDGNLIVGMKHRTRFNTFHIVRKSGK